MSLESAWDWRFWGRLAARGRSGSIIESMLIDMNESQVRTLEQVRQVLAGTQAMEFQAAADDEGRYAWIESVLRRFEYRRLLRADRGPVLAYLQRLSGGWGRPQAVGAPGVLCRRRCLQRDHGRGSDSGDEASIEKLALKKGGLTLDQMDVIESNEAFAAQAIAVARGLEFELTKVKPNGGAIALGHPIGCSGAFLATKAVYELHRARGRYALATMCIGGGQGIAAMFERL